MKLSQRGAGIIASGLFTVITLFVLWVPFLALIGFDLVRAAVQGGLCGPIGAAISKQQGEFNQQWQQMQDQLIQKHPTKANEITEYFAKLRTAISTIADTAEEQLFNPNTSFTVADAEFNQTLITWMWITLGVVVTLCSLGIYYFVSAYQLDWGTFLTRNFITLVFVMLVELSIFGGIAMQYIPWNINDIVAGVFAELS